MPLPSSGKITIGDIQAEFGGPAAPKVLTSYYRGGAYVPAAASSRIPTSGIIKLSDFYGAAKVTGGQTNYLSPGTYSWVCPPGVTSVCVVCCGAARYYQNRDTANNIVISPAPPINHKTTGGSVSWGNNIPVTPGQTYTVVVGGYYDKLASSFNGNMLYAGKGAYVGGTHRQGGGLGGNYSTYDMDAPTVTWPRNTSWPSSLDGGPGAGGYTGNGGTCVAIAGNSSTLYASGGAGGAGIVNSSGQTGGGGGVGIYGQGASGQRGTEASPHGGGGSGGGSTGYTGGYYGDNDGGLYGGGAGVRMYGSDLATGYMPGGFVRIIWGSGRAYPSTNTGDI